MKNKIRDKRFLIKNLKKTPIIQFACERTGIARATFYRWKKEDKEFANKVGIALESGKNLINDMAESQLLSAIRDKNLGAIIFWLRNNHPRYTTKVELTTKDAQPKELTAEQKKLIEQALVLGSLSKDKGIVNEKI